MSSFSRRYQQQIKKAKRLALALVFIVLALAVNQLITRFKLLEKPIVDTSSAQPLAVLVFLSYTEPTLIPDTSPVDQLDSFVSSISAQNYNLFPNGDLLPGQDTSSINLIFSQKPSKQKLEHFYRSITNVIHTLPTTKSYLVKDDLYLISKNLPDIIIDSSFSNEKLSNSLQSIPSLAKIKEGIKIIDLRFNHPVIK